jgi:hypothetical protein
MSSKGKLSDGTSSLLAASTGAAVPRCDRGRPICRAVRGVGAGATVATGGDAAAEALSPPAAAAAASGTRGAAVCAAARARSSSLRWPVRAGWGAAMLGKGAGGAVLAAAAVPAARSDLSLHFLPSDSSRLETAAIAAVSADLLLLEMSTTARSLRDTRAAASAPAASSGSFVLAVMRTSRTRVPVARQTDEAPSKGATTSCV